MSRQPTSTFSPRPLVLAAALAGFTGCGDTQAPSARIQLPTVEIGQTFTASELSEQNGTNALWLNEPAPLTVLPPHREPIGGASPLTEFPVTVDANGQPLLGVPGFDMPFAPTPAPEQAPLSEYDEPSKLTGPAELTLTPDQDAAGEDPSWADAWSDWPTDPETPEAIDEPQETLAQEPEASLLFTKPEIETPREDPILAKPLPKKPVNEPRALDLFGAPPAPPTAQTDPEPVEKADEASLTDFEASLESHEDLLAEVPAAQEIGRLMLEPIREGFALGRSGAVYAARVKFEDALRQIATAKDAEAGNDSHSRSLADGFLALEEAQHFLSHGDTPAAGFDAATIARGHFTPVLDKVDYEGTSRQEAIARYHLYAAKRLAAAVQGEQAGSMALFGLGKAYARLAALSDDSIAQRRGLAMHRAAVLAHGGNHLAANELGVGLAKAGHYRAAKRALDHAIARGGNSTVHHNLAMVHHRLEQPRLAMAVQQQAERLAANERQAGAFSKQLGVQWVAPHQFARSGGQAPRPASPPTAVAGNRPATPTKSQAIVR